MELANTILTEYHNSGDEWQSAMSNLDAVLDLRPQPDAHGPVRPRPLAACPILCQSRCSSSA